MFKAITTMLCACLAATAISAQGPKQQAKVSMRVARATALKEVPNGKVQSEELEREKGKLIYSFDIKVTGRSGIDEVHIDAITGKVLSKEHETPAMEAKEKK